MAPGVSVEEQSSLAVHWKDAGLFPPLPPPPPGGWDRTWAAGVGTLAGGTVPLQEEKPSLAVLLGPSVMEHSAFAVPTWTGRPAGGAVPTPDRGGGKQPVLGEQPALSPWPCPRGWVNELPFEGDGTLASKSIIELHREHD